MLYRELVGECYDTASPTGTHNSNLLLPRAMQLRRIVASQCQPIAFCTFWSACSVLKLQFQIIIFSLFMLFQTAENQKSIIDAMGDS